jgi:hypothetical protein
MYGNSSVGDLCCLFGYNSVLLVVVYTLFDALSVASSAIPILQSYSLTILQENVDTVSVGTAESVGEGDRIKVKTEHDYIQLVRTVKTEEVLSVLW